MLSRLLLFAARDDNRPILQCVSFEARDGKLISVSVDGFRLAIVSFDYDDGEGQVLINTDDLKGIVGALRKAKRARVSFEQSGKSIDGTNLIIDTELIRYKMVGVEGNYPEWKRLVSTEFNCQAHFDTLEAIKAANSLKALSNSKDYPIDLRIGDGKIVMTNTDGKGWAELVADTDGEVKIRVDGGYLAEALKACGGMADLKLTNAYSPMLFTTDSYQLVVMPIMTSEVSEKAKADREAEGAESEAEVESKATEQLKADNTEPATKPTPKKSKRSPAKEPVTIS